MLSDEKKMLDKARLERLKLVSNGPAPVELAVRHQLTHSQRKDLHTIALGVASKNRSDPFTYNRVMSHGLNGVKSGADYMEEYRVVNSAD